MRQLIVSVLVLLSLYSCEKGYTVNQMRILIKNETDSTITVKLYPRSKYVRYGKYAYSDMHTMYKDTAFIPDTKLGTELFSTDTVEMKPHILATRVFDSIWIKKASGKSQNYRPWEWLTLKRILFQTKRHGSIRETSLNMSECGEKTELNQRIIF